MIKRFWLQVHSAWRCMCVSARRVELWRDWVQVLIIRWLLETWTDSDECMTVKIHKIDSNWWQGGIVVCAVASLQEGSFSISVSSRSLHVLLGCGGIRVRVHFCPSCWPLNGLATCTGPEHDEVIWVGGLVPHVWWKGLMTWSSLCDATCRNFITRPDRYRCMMMLDPSFRIHV